MGMQNQDMNLVLSTDAKPRLKWTPELHQRFIEAVTQLGGADKATPKTLMRMMGIPGLTLYHLKSHLQKYRLGKIQQSETCSDTKQEGGVHNLSDADYRDNQCTDVHFNMEVSDGTQIQINESFKVSQALQMQMEVQRKLHEQIEVQRHLQLRIEAQGKYLQSVLKKAQETLAGYNSSSSGVELAKAELSQLVSMVNTGCTSSLSGLTTEAENSSLKDVDKNLKKRGADGSMESSLTSSESSGRNEEKQLKPKTGDNYMFNNITPVVLPLMETLTGDGQLSKNSLCYGSNGRKRSGSTISDGNCFEQPPPTKRSPIYTEKAGNQLRMFEFSEKFDLNSQYQVDINSGPRVLDLNCKGTEQFNGHL